MGDDFDEWNHKKKHLHALPLAPFFHEKEIWFCSLGINIGNEQNGQGDDFQRPILILKKFNNSFLLCVPLSKTKRRGPYHFPFIFIDEITSVGLLSQIRPLSALRLSRKIGAMDEASFRLLIEKIKAMLP